AGRLVVLRHSVRKRITSSPAISSKLIRRLASKAGRTFRDSAAIGKHRGSLAGIERQDSTALITVLLCRCQVASSIRLGVFVFPRPDRMLGQCDSFALLACRCTPPGQPWSPHEKKSYGDAQGACPSGRINLPNAVSPNLCNAKTSAQSDQSVRALTLT